MDCQHLSQVDDYGTGDTICTECGLVLDRLLSPIEIKGHPQIDRLKRQAFFDDICDSNMMNPGVAKRAMLEYETLVLRPAAAKIKEKKLKAYALYAATVKEGAARDPEEVAVYAEVDKSDLCKIETLFPLPLKLQKATRYLARFCYYHGITYKQQKEIEALYDVITTVDGYHAKTVTASLILLYCQEQQKYSGLFTHVTGKSVADTCHVSTSAIDQCMRAIRKELESEGIVVVKK